MVASLRTKGCDPLTPPSFRASFEEHAPLVRRLVRRYGVSCSDREDLVQEIFFVVHRKLHEYDGRAPFRSWLDGICVRIISSYRRSAQVRRQQSRVDDAIEEYESPSSGPEQCLDVRRA